MRDNWNIALNRQTKRQKARPAYVSLNRRGEIAVNDKAFKMIGCPYNVAILYLPPQPSADNNSAAGGELKGVIGVKYPATDDREFFPVRRYGRGGRMRIIRAAYALKQFGLTVDETLKFYDPPLVYHRDQPMLVLELSRSPPA